MGFVVGKFINSIQEIIFSMEKIIKINKKYLNQLAQVDLESEHPLEKDFALTLNYHKKVLKKRFKQNHEIFFGYFINKELIAYSTMKPFFPGHNHCEFYWLSVKKSYQGRGIGTKLIKYREKIDKKMGFRKAYIYMNKKNKKIIRIYKKLKYKFINEFPDYLNYKQNNTAILYAKQI